MYFTDVQSIHRKRVLRKRKISVLLLPITHAGGRPEERNLSTEVSHKTIGHGTTCRILSENATSALQKYTGFRYITFQSPTKFKLDP